MRMRMSSHVCVYCGSKVVAVEVVVLVVCNHMSQFFESYFIILHISPSSAKLTTHMAVEITIDHKR